MRTYTHAEVMAAIEKCARKSVPAHIQSTFSGVLLVARALGLSDSELNRLNALADEGWKEYVERQSAGYSQP